MIYNIFEYDVTITCVERLRHWLIMVMLLECPPSFQDVLTVICLFVHLLWNIILFGLFKCDKRVSFLETDLTRLLIFYKSLWTNVVKNTISHGFLQHSFCWRFINLKNNRQLPQRNMNAAISTTETAFNCKQTRVK